MSQDTLPKYDLEDLAKPMITLLDQNQEHFVGWARIHKLLLDGKPVSPDQIATLLGLTWEEVASLLKGAELDQEGNLVGVGLSIVPTRHSYKILGRQLYTWCAVDAITYPILHRASAQIESSDPISGEKIRLTSTPEGVRDVDPVTAVVSLVTGMERRENVRAWFCHYAHFFRSVETASQYVIRHPGLVIVPVEEVFRIGQLLWEREPYESMMDELSLTNQL
jgi:alkylmercury lyase